MSVEITSIDSVLCQRCTGTVNYLSRLPNAIILTYSHMTAPIEESLLLTQLLHSLSLKLKSFEGSTGAS